MQSNIEYLIFQMTQLYQHVIGPKFAEINCQGISMLSGKIAYVAIRNNISVKLQLSE